MISISCLVLLIGFRYMIKNLSPSSKINWLPQKKKSIHDFPSLQPKEIVDFTMAALYKPEPSAFKPSTISNSFRQVRLWPCNPDKIRNLCQIHCPPLSQLNSTKRLRELEFIMKNIYEEQEAERKKMIADGKRLREGLSLDGKRYQLRKRKRTEP